MYKTSFSDGDGKNNLIKIFLCGVINLCLKFGKKVFEKNHSQIHLD